MNNRDPFGANPPGRHCLRRPLPITRDPVRYARELRELIIRSNDGAPRHGSSSSNGGRGGGHGYR